MNNDTLYTLAKKATIVLTVKCYFHETIIHKLVIYQINEAEASSNTRWCIIRSS